MADEGEVRFAEVGAPARLAGHSTASSHWRPRGGRGRLGTGLAQDADGDAAFIRQACRWPRRAPELFAAGAVLDQTLLASGIVIRQGDHALFFKIAFDEAFARFSPGVQLTVELTRRLCADPAIRFVGSTADQGPSDDRPRLARTHGGWRSLHPHRPVGAAGRRLSIRPRHCPRRVRERGQVLYLFPHFR